MEIKLQGISILQISYASLQDTITILSMKNIFGVLPALTLLLIALFFFSYNCGCFGFHWRPAVIQTHLSLKRHKCKYEFQYECFMPGTQNRVNT